MFYPQNQHLPYAVDVIYQTVLPNGVESELEIAYKDPKTNCTITRWRWTSSPIFLLARPKYLNYIVFFTMNYFRDWTTPSVTIKVPYPCPNSTIQFLSQMTSLVSFPGKFLSVLYTRVKCTFIYCNLTSHMYYAIYGSMNHCMCMCTLLAI